MSIATLSLKSKILFMPTEVSVVLPDPKPGKSYEKGRKYKVLWLLHGANSDHTEWLYGSTLMKNLRGRDVIAVMPSALNSDYGCYPDFGNGYDFPKYFFEELMPIIYGQFSGSDKPEDNFIAGGSMGAFGALELGLMHPEKFGGIASFGGSLRESQFLEPYVGMTGAQFRSYAMEHRTDFPTEYGSAAEGIKPKEINVIAKYPTVQDFLDSPECMFRRFPEALASGNLPPMYMLVGTKDLFYDANVRFKALADSLGAENITYNFIEGRGHEGALWSQGLEEILKLWDI